MYHFFAEHENISDDYIDIRGGDVNHIKNVIRLKAGDEVLISLSLIHISEPTRPY